MPGQVFVTGGSGFVGSAVIRELRDRNYTINALTNQRPLPGLDEDVHNIKGGLFNNDKALDEGMRDCLAVIHLVGIIMENPKHGITFERMHVEGTKKIVDAAKRAGVRRYIHMSALGTQANAQTEYHRTKFRAEEYVRNSGLDWTIIRPSLIHGPRGEFMAMEAKWARKSAPPFIAMPYFGAGIFGTGGAGQLQPVFVNDVAKAFADALEKPNTIGKVYELGGSQRITWPQMHEIVATAIVGHPRWTMPFPVPVAKTLAAIGLGRLLKFNSDQVTMSQQDNVCDLTPFITDFGWTPQGFKDSLQTYASQL